MSSPGYLHGYRPEERERLRRQARFLGPKVHDGLPFAECSRILEVGCGVGAQTEMLLEAFPRAHVTGIDRSGAQVELARHHAPTSHRCTFIEGDAANLTFGPAAFDGAFLCWVLEHVSEPCRVLAEVRRVLTPGAPIACSEVLNASLFLHPESPSTALYWQAYNAEQVSLGGDPTVGAKLGHLLAAVGFRNIRTRPTVIHLDDRRSAEKVAMMAYFSELLLSAAPALLRSGRVEPQLIGEVERELDRVASSPAGVFFYSFIQAQAVA